MRRLSEKLEDSEIVALLNDRNRYIRSSELRFIKDKRRRLKVYFEYDLGPVMSGMDSPAFEELADYILKLIK